MKRYYPHLTRQFVSKACRKIAKLNLTKVFNKSTIKQRLRNLKNDFQSTYRDKIKAEYHYEQPAAGKSPKITIAKNHYGTIRTTIRSPPSTETAIDLSPKRTGFEQFYGDLIGRHNREPVSDMKAPKPAKKKPLPATPIVKEATHQSLQIIEMSEGRYLNFGLAHAIRQNSRGCLMGPMQLTVAAYVHHIKNQNGVEVAQYMILLGRLSTDSVPRKRSSGSFLIGIYQGTFANMSVGNEIFRPFVSEMTGIMKNGLVKMCPPLDDNNNGDDQTLYDGPVTLHAFVVDSFSHSLLTCTALPSSIFGCPKCRLKGQLQFNCGITSYPAYCQPDCLRKDDDYKKCFDHNYHLAVPVVQQLGFGLVSQVVLDYKHSVCTGVMKRMWNMWTKGQLDYRLNKASLQRINAQLIQLGRNRPTEFRHGPKTIDDIDLWTPYDWRQFLLYYGPIVLENALSSKFYIHFLCLHLAVRIMINRNAFKKYNAFIVGFLLKRFVSEFSVYYGAEQLDHNIHGLLHYEEVMQRYGSVENVGGFDFDDQMEGLIERLTPVDGVDADLETIREEFQTVTGNQGMTALRVEEEIFFDGNYNLHFNGFQLSTTHPDNYIVTTKGVVKLVRIVQNQNGTVLLLGQKFKSAFVLFQAPLTDEKLWLISDVDDVEAFQLSEVIAKGVRLDTPRGVCVMPLLSM